MVQWKKVLKRKVYPTWTTTRRINGCKAYIFYIENSEPFYHFQVVCDEDIRYSSIFHGLKYKTFEEASEQAENWLKNHKGC